MAQKKIELLKGKVIDGAVWLKGSCPPVSAEQAKAWVDAGEAKYVESPAIAPGLDTSRKERAGHSTDSSALGDKS